MFLLSFLIIFSGLNGQDLSPLIIDFTVNNTVLKNPLTGGINTPQVSKADFNNDGLMDLYVFDRSGNVSIVYLNDGITNQAAYTYAPRYAENFPDLVDWVLLRDFNQDGAMDIFTAARTPGISGIEVLRGYYENGELKFAPFYFPQFQFNVIPFRLGNGSFTNLYVSSQDLPAIDDIDGDGDMDIVSFGVNGGYMEYFTNQSVEDGFGPDQDCNYPSTDVPVDLPSFPASFFVDINNDGKRDLLAAPNSPRRVEDFFNLWYYRNDGTDAVPDFNFQRKDLLTHNTLDMGSGSSPVFVDFDQDGLQDIIVGTKMRGDLRLLLAI